MSSIPLPALQVRPPEQPDLLGQLGKLQQLKNMGQQGQIQQQTIQENQLQLQLKQQQMKDQQVVMQVAQKYPNGLSDPQALQELSGKVSAATYIPLQKSIVDTQKSYAELDEKKLANEKARADQFLGLIQQAKALPPDQYAQQFPQIAAAAVQIEPKLQGQIDPTKPIPQQALDSIGLGFATHSQLATVEQEKRAQAEEARKAALAPSQLAESQAEATIKQNEAALGGNQALADTRYRNIKERQRLGQPVTAGDTAFLGAYEDQKKASQPYGGARVEIAQQNANRQDENYIDKTYVKPAQDTEKSYQMFMEAYNNRNNAKTGAESMLALSTHLATTFGNVKGSRVTKDMIQEHLGARGISDSALVAVQKLSNGDVLSPDQWDAFKSLISNSRKLSWDSAKIGAKHRGVDIADELPKDMGGAATSQSTGGNDPFSAFGGAKKP